MLIHSELMKDDVAMLALLEYIIMVYLLVDQQQTEPKQANYVLRSTV